MAPLVLDLHDLAATVRLGSVLARDLRVGDVIALHGDLGAGKTELARAIIRQAAHDAELIVPSPTFTLAEVYDMPSGGIWHFDLYRIASPEQVWELGFEEALADGISLIEWPERLAASLPAQRLDIALELEGDAARRATLTGDPSWHDRIATVARELAHG